VYRVLFCALCCGTAWAVDSVIKRFNGSESGRTPVFETPGAWLLDRSTRSDDLLPKTFELGLYGAESSEYIGTIVQLQENGSGRKLFEDAGQYQIEVAARNFTWMLEIPDFAPAEAARLKRFGDGRSTLQDFSQVRARRGREDSFSSWRPADNETLLLFADDEPRGFRITFSSTCKGLNHATVLSFISAGYSGTELYDSIMLEDGTHCSFRRVAPTVFDERRQRWSTYSPALACSPPLQLKQSFSRKPIIDSYSAI